MRDSAVDLTSKEISICANCAADLCSLHSDHILFEMVTGFRNLQEFLPSFQTYYQNLCFCNFFLRNKVKTHFHQKIDGSLMVDEVRFLLILSWLVSLFYHHCKKFGKILGQTMKLLKQML